MIPNATAGPIDFGGLITAQAALGVAMYSVDIQTETEKATLANANTDGMVFNRPAASSSI
jgi:hypothetical protein